jgi:hypothetical protein
MAKYYGAIGYVKLEETDPENHPGVFEEVVTERPYYVDVLANKKRFERGEDLNDDLNVRNEFSILADPYAMESLAQMRYLTWLGAKWKITDVKVDYPRMTLSVGGVYNGPES